MNNQNTFVSKNAAYFRARGREALKGNWGIAIGAMLLAGILGAFSSGFSFNFDLKDLGVNARDLANPAYYTMENLQALLAKFSSNLSIFLLSLVTFAAFTTVAWRLFVGSPVFLGYQKFQLDLIDKKPTYIKTLFDGFKTGYIKSVLLRVLLALIALLCCIPMFVACGAGVVVCLPTIRTILAGDALAAQDYVFFSVAMLLVLLGSLATSIVSIIITLRYEFAFVILAEYPELSPVEALQKSRSLMQGNKWRLFCLEFSFIGWYLLSALFTCGIGFIWAIPYRNVSVMAFYDEIANRKVAAETEFPSLNPDDYAPSDTSF